MRRLTWGLLVTVGLVSSACGADTTTSAVPDPAPPPAVVDTALAAASSATDTASTGSTGTRSNGARSNTAGPDELAPPSSTAYTVLVTSPEGVTAPGVDALASTLLARPDLAVEVVAPASDVSHDPAGVGTGAMVGVDAATMSGLPATAVNGSMIDTLTTVLAEGMRPDLVVVGASADPAASDAATAAAEVARAHDLPVLVVTVAVEDPDLAAATMLLTSALDQHFDSLVSSPAIHDLTIPACITGTIEGPVLPVERSERPLPDADCTSTAGGPFADEADAMANGWATLSRRA